MRQIVGNVDIAFVQFQQLDLLLLFTCTENYADWWFLSRLAIVFIQPAKIEFHLAFMAMVEVFSFEIDSNQAFQLSVIEQQVYVEAVVINQNTFLPG